MDFKILQAYINLCEIKKLDASWEGLIEFKNNFFGGVGLTMDLKWIKISLDIFYDEKMKLIEAMPENDTINYIWIRLLIQAGRTNAGGLIFLSEGKPYTEEMLATIFNRPINSIRLGVGTLRNLGMIDIDKNNIIRIVNWEKYQNVEGMERVREQTRKRVAKCRAKKKNDVMESNVTVTKEKEEEDNRYINISIKKENEDIDKKSIELVSYYENLLGRVGVLNIPSIRLALKMYDLKYVKMAIDKAIEVDKITMGYINGILKNWEREGYPKEKGVSNGGEFSGFKPNEPEVLSENERARAEDLI
ncbi:Uncharacterised protein [Clostridium paraputrificum]|uniref:Phage replisome organiser N-terminal domain-containing protein n=3 Tax=Clostridium TaxID=1485 RepID=A0A6N3EL13_9CLOT